MKKIGLLFALCLMSTSGLFAQAITTAAPFLLIIPDARAGAMGDVGVSTSADASSLFHNPSKIAFSGREVLIGINYSPWLRNLTDDIFIGSASYIRRTSENAAWGVEFRYFSLGQVDLTDFVNGEVIDLGSINPNEFAISGTYALKLSETFSMGVSGRYFRSNLAFTGINSTLQPINSFAVDVSGYYQSPEENYGTFNGRWRFGFNIANIGPKVSYVPGEEDFIPTNLKFGGGFDFILDDYNIISLNTEFTKLLVPSPQADQDQGFISGIFGSFGDAEGGFSEELKEFTYALGAEYLYNNAFAIRAGYFHENPDKGNRQFFTLGAGFKTNALNVDLSYLINSSDVNNPLENSLRFSISFDLGEVFDDY